MDESHEINNVINVENHIHSDDKEFCLFYYGAIKRLLDIDNKENASHLHRCLKLLDKYYTCWCDVRKLDNEKRDDTIKELEDSLYFRIAFVYRNAVLLSSAVAFHFRNVYKKTPDVISRLIKKQQVKICSFGSRSASDVVALVKVLESFANKNVAQLDFRVTIIDSDERWKNTYITVLSCLEQFNEATWKINFIHDLSQKNSWLPETCKAVQEADIITMVRCQYNLKNKAIKKICELSQPHTIIFILDHPQTKFINVTLDMTELRHLHLIHVELFDYHTLDVEAMQQLKTLYCKHFGDEKYCRSNISFSVYASVWIKLNPESDAKHKSNLQCLFQDNEEKFNPKQGLLSTNAFTKWETLFTKEKEELGWTKKGIRKVVQTEKEKRSRLLGDFIPVKKGLELIQKMSLAKFEAPEFKETEYRDTCKESLGKYLTQKKQYSSMKQNAYFASLHYYK